MRLSVIRDIERKELSLFFSAPIGYLFLAAFLAVTLFVFFWVEAFFARNIADVRPMFEWMPLLMIFLSAAITMRMWSEERRTGTLEFVATLPATTWEFVLGKFLACWLLLALALLLTLPIPLVVSFIADLDWGPVLAGYVAALLLGGAYLAIGLYVSARSDSQIVALIVTSLVAGLFYMLGSPLLVSLSGGWVADTLLAIGAGSRFESITRGVLDLRDLYYYSSIAIVFLALNVYALTRERWAPDGDNSVHRGWRVGTALLVGNLLLANVWLADVGSARFDLTQGRIYSISDATRGFLGQLREPLLIRGYFSEKTHPLLAPLVPRMKDLLREYEIAGKGRVRVEIVDPASNPEAEDEANTKYSIKPVPFQVADRYQASLVNAYYDVLIVYGDKYEVLDFRDLIEVKVTGESDIDVQLRNPEFDITRSIKKVLYGFQGGDSLFASITDPVRFQAYISADDKLPDALVAYRGVVDKVLDELRQKAGDKLTVDVVDPQAGDGAVALEIQEKYGFQPMAMSLFDTNQFYFYMTLQQGDLVVQIPLVEGLTAESTTKAIEDGLKRFARGLLKRVVLVTPSPMPGQMPYMQPQGNQFSQLRDLLASDFEVESATLDDGKVPANAEMLIVLDPENFSQKQVFAVDQYLMQGGTVVLSAGAFDAQIAEQSLMASPQTTGLEDWLTGMGVKVDKSLVLDPQNSPFPVPVTRRVGGFSFQDLMMLDYPYFPDIRPEGMADLPIFQGLPQVTMPWVSPLTVSEEARKAHTVTELLKSSAGAWHSSDTNVVPKFDDQGLSTFAPVGDTGVQLLAVSLQGRFDSFFKGKPSPLLEESPKAEAADNPDEAEAAKTPVASSVIERSPESARLFVFGSNSFLADQTLRMVGAADGTFYGNSVQMMANLADWALEDESLTGIRARGNFNRTLPPLEEGTRLTIEYLSYGLALLGVIIVYIIWRRLRGRRREQVIAWMQGGAA
ncbi:MAG: Gldg family protein [Pseudomonadales bacterium]|nr:Gldg family protein [Pseudomonadales bacterium]